jgi:hypothetical protein
VQKTIPPSGQLNEIEPGGPLTKPPVIESTIAESEVTSTNSPSDPDISKHPTVPLAPLPAPKRYFQVNWWSVIALALLLILIGEHAAPFVLTLVDGYLHPKATVTIFPAQKQMSHTYSYLVVTGTADPSHNQIPSQVLTLTTPTKTATITTTGIGYTPAVQAKGTITFYNEAPYSQTIYAGTVITAINGIQIVTALSVTIAAGNGVTNGSAETKAHTIQAGVRANIPSLSIKALCCVNGILAKNLSPFTGGEDPKPYPMLSNADLKREAAHLAGTLSPLAKAGIQSQMRDVEKNLVPVRCSTHTASNPKVGQRAATATISVSETCMTQVYDNSSLQQFASIQFMQDAAKQLGSNFAQSGDLTIARQKTTLLDASHSTYRMVISAEGTLVFHLTASQTQTLKKSIAGKSVIEAKQELLQLAGVQGVHIQPAHQSDISLPTDPGSIKLEVSGRNY